MQSRRDWTGASSAENWSKCPGWLKKLDYCYRALGTGFCFAVFGIGCVVVGITILPMIMLCSGNALTRQRRTRQLASLSFRLLLALIRGMGLGRVEVEGGEWLRSAPGRLVLATHPNYLDAVVLLSLLPMADCVIKDDLWHNPFIRAFVIAAGYISNENSPGVIETCIRTVQNGKILVLFPEGTRSTPGKPLCFKRGAAQIAVRGDLEILPVVMYCAPPALFKSSKWYQVPERAWVLHVKIFPPCPISDFLPRVPLPPGVAVRRATRALQNFFQEQIAHYESAD
ncbi:MAG: lysophospholipid acyltransferase family protein [Gammaproteobacteria bacterium]